MIDFPHFYPGFWKTRHLWCKKHVNNTRNTEGVIDSGEMSGFASYRPDIPMCAGSLIPVPSVQKRWVHLAHVLKNPECTPSITDPFKAINDRKHYNHLDSRRNSFAFFICIFLQRDHQQIAQLNFLHEILQLGRLVRFAVGRCAGFFFAAGAFFVKSTSCYIPFFLRRDI